MFRKLFPKRRYDSPAAPDARSQAAPQAAQRHCFIRFEVVSPTALERLTAMVEAFKTDKLAVKGRAEEEWASFFFEDELATFWRPTEEEQQAWQTYWFSTPLPKRHSAEMPMPGWHFDSMLKAILEDGDYDLIGVHETGGREAVLEFDPHGYPYGGTGALRALVWAFGHRIVGVDDGTGYEAGDPQAPRWTPEIHGGP